LSKVIALVDRTNAVHDFRDALAYSVTSCLIKLLALLLIILLILKDKLISSQITRF